MSKQQVMLSLFRLKVSLALLGGHVLLRPAVGLVGVPVGLLANTKAARDDFRDATVLKWGLENFFFE